ncbi:MAG TPA: ribosome small subunit-dependent GTPase A [Streptosporangiaceae bacterium]|nr:ribosome small subunit-dependent GTPase A [Streptosporangiaceae bacterium]
MADDAGRRALIGRASHDRLDEDDVRVRPGRGSRPRTRRRPAHEDAAEGFVAAVERGRYGILVDGRRITAMRARELGRRGVVVGDTVALAGDVSGAPGTLARVVRVEPRTTVLRRSADDADPVERVIVANASQLVIVTALANPPPRPRLIDRFLVAAYDAGLAPLLCLTKADLAPPDELLAAYGPLGVPHVVIGRPLTSGVLVPLREHLIGRISVLVGHSGVGKSTLVNALIPDADRVVGEVSPVTGRGRHTSSSVVALPLPDTGGGWIIDTPGLRSFGLAHVTPDRVVRAFPDLAGGVAACPPGCTHLEPDCALDDWVRDQGSDPRLVARLDSLRRLLRSREGAEPAARDDDEPVGDYQA